MDNLELNLAGRKFDLIRMTRSTTSQALLDASATALFRLFLVREKEFAFNPNIIVDYPAIEDSLPAPFLTQPIRYIGNLCRRLNAGPASPISRIVILTTFGNRLAVPLRTAGYQATSISMPAGPNFTMCFEREFTVQPKERTLYIEAVNEADEKIRTSFVIELLDDRGRLCGGACGSIHESDGQRFAYLATMTLDVDLPPATGITLGEALLDFLRTQGVNTVHLGTQTAGPFYQKLGFRIVHTVLSRLRSRISFDGQAVFTDLVMMEGDLSRLRTGKVNP